MASVVKVLNRALKDCPFYVITRASLMMTSAFKATFAAGGIGHVRPSFLVVLWCLWDEDGLKVRDLGQRAGLEPSTMTGLLDRMERDGLVTRLSDPEDRRALRIHLTDAGKALRGTVRRLVGETLEMLFEGIAEPEIDRLNEVLKRVMANARGETV